MVAVTKGGLMLPHFIELSQHGTQPPQKVAINVDHIVKMLTHTDGSAVLSLSTKGEKTHDVVHVTESFGEVKEMLRNGRGLGA